MLTINRVPTGQAIPVRLVLVMAFFLSSQLLSAQGGVPGGALLEQFLKARGKNDKGIVVGMAGFYGQHQPGEWRILVREEGDSRRVHEIKYRYGGEISRRLISSNPNFDIPSTPIPGRSCQSGLRWRLPCLRTGSLKQRCGIREPALSASMPTQGWRTCLDGSAQRQHPTYGRLPLRLGT